MASDSSGFLVQVASGSTDATAASVGPWKQILDAAKVSVDATSSVTDVNITNADLWGLQFSSVSNADYFKNVPEGTTISNHAWIGDDLDCRYFHKSINHQN